MPQHAFYIGREWNVDLDRKVKVSNAELRYTVLGKGEPVLYIHGTSIADSLITPLRFYPPLFDFIVLPGQFGNGFSSSPSNTPAPFDLGAFPPIHVADDVIAQHRLLTEHFGISELQLVLGWSVGAFQTYEWAVRFPQMVKRMASIAGAPQPSPWTRLWLSTVIEEPITSDPHWNSGFYADRLDVQAGLRRQGHRMALTLPPLSYYHGNVLRSLGFASVDDFVRGFFEGFMIGQDPNNLLIFVYAFTGEVMFPPEDCRLDAARIPGARFHELTMTSGHLTTFGLFPADKQAVDDAIREVLAN